MQVPVSLTAHCRTPTSATLSSRRAVLSTPTCGPGWGLMSLVVPDPACSHSAPTPSRRRAISKTASTRGRQPTDRGTPNSRISIVEAFWMATMGGAELLGLPTGALEVGRPFDALAVDTRRHWFAAAGLARPRRRRPHLREDCAPRHPRRHHRRVGRGPSRRWRPSLTPVTQGRLSPDHCGSPHRSLAESRLGFKLS